MIDIVIIHSNKDEYRERNLLYIIERYKRLIPKSNLILVEQNTETNNIIIDKFVDIKVNIKTHFDLFCRSLCLNEGFKKCKNEYIIFSDNDCVIDEDFLFEKHFLNNDCIIPYNKEVINLNNEQTIKYINNIQINDTIEKRPFISRGGILCIRRALYYNVGGYDPRFIGWGGEDDAFWEKMIKLSKINRYNGELIHLFIPKKNIQ